ncbi:hypothetical protein LEMLEM_LOCUS5941 [Lemmus lemmus]
MLRNCNQTHCAIQEEVEVKERKKVEIRIFSVHGFAKRAGTGAGRSKGRADAAGGVASRQPAAPPQRKCCWVRPFFIRPVQARPALGLISPEQIGSESDLNRRPCFESRERRSWVGATGCSPSLPLSHPPHPFSVLRAATSAAGNGTGDPRTGSGRYGSSEYSPSSTGVHTHCAPRSRYEEARTAPPSSFQTTEVTAQIEGNVAIPPRFPGRTGSHRQPPLPLALPEQLLVSLLRNLRKSKRTGTLPPASSLHLSFPGWPCHARSQLLKLKKKLVCGYPRIPGVDRSVGIHTSASASSQHQPEVCRTYAAPPSKGFSLFSSWENEERRGRKRRKAVDGKRRINVHLVRVAKSREGTSRGAAKRELPIKTSSENPGGGGGGGAGRVTSP